MVVNVHILYLFSHCVSFVLLIIDFIVIFTCTFDTCSIKRSINYTNACLYLVSVHQMAPPQTNMLQLLYRWSLLKTIQFLSLFYLVSSGVFKQKGVVEAAVGVSQNYQLHKRQRSTLRHKKCEGRSVFHAVTSKCCVVSSIWRKIGKQYRMNERWAGESTRIPRPSKHS